METRKAAVRVQTRGLALRGDLEILQVRSRITTNRSLVGLDMCVRDNKFLTDVKSGAVVDPVPGPRPVKKAGVGVRLDGSQWKVELYGQPTGVLECVG